MYIYIPSSSSYYLSGLRNYAALSMMGGGVLTWNRGYISARICLINYCLDTTSISNHILSQLTPSLSSLYVEVNRIPPCQYPHDPTSALEMNIPTSFPSLHISHILTSLLCINLSCYVLGCQTPQQATVLPPKVPSQRVGTPNFCMFATGAVSPLDYGQPNCGIYPVPSGGVGTRTTYTTRIVGLVAPLLYITSLAFLHMITPVIRCATTFSIYYAIY